MEMNHKMNKRRISLISAWSYKIAENCQPAVNSFLATHFETQEEFEKAFSQMVLTIKKDPQNRNLYEKMVWIAHRAQRLDQGKELIESGLSKHPEDYRINRALGLTCLLNSEYPLAIKSLEKSLQLKTDEGVTHFLLGCSFCRLLDKNENPLDSGSDLLNSIQDEFHKAGEMDFFKDDPDFLEGKEYLDKGVFARSLEKMGLALVKIKELQAEPVSFSYLALSFLMDDREIDQNQVEYTIDDLKKRCEQKKKYPKINNHLGLCLLIFWRSLLLHAQNQLGLAVKKDAKFQKAKTNLTILENSGKKISTLLQELRF